MQVSRSPALFMSFLGIPIATTINVTNLPIPKVTSDQLCLGHCQSRFVYAFSVDTYGQQHELASNWTTERRLWNRPICTLCHRRSVTKHVNLAKDDPSLSICAQNGQSLDVGVCLYPLFFFFFFSLRVPRIHRLMSSQRF